MTLDEAQIKEQERIGIPLLVASGVGLVFLMTITIVFLAFRKSQRRREKSRGLPPKENRCENGSSEPEVSAASTDVIIGTMDEHRRVTRFEQARGPIRSIHASLHNADSMSEESRKIDEWAAQQARQSFLTPSRSDGGGQLSQGDWSGPRWTNLVLQTSPSSMERLESDSHSDKPTKSRASLEASTRSEDQSDEIEVLEPTQISFGGLVWQELGQSDEGSETQSGATQSAFQDKQMGSRRRTRDARLMSTPTPEIIQTHEKKRVTTALKLGVKSLVSLRGQYTGEEEKSKADQIYYWEMVPQAPQDDWWQLPFPPQLSPLSPDLFGTFQSPSSP